MAMKNPPHPGLTVTHDCLEPLGLKVSEAANVLGVTRQTFNNLLNGKAEFAGDGPVAGQGVRQPRRGWAYNLITTSRRYGRARPRSKSSE